jgi:FkbM family methyltransferase
MFRQFWKALKNADRVPEIFRCRAETQQWARVTAAYLGISRLTYPYVLHLRSGERIRLEELTDLKTFWQVFLRRVYRVKATDRVILDLGANIGIFTLYAARQAPEATILSLEPFPATYDRLLANIRNHKLESRVICVKQALTGSPGTRIMHDGMLPSQRRSLAPSASAAHGELVLGKTLRETIEGNNFARIDLLKMDIEGSENETLLATGPPVLARIRRIALEYHGDSAPYTKDQLFEHLHRSGFSSAWDVCDESGYGLVEMIFQKAS